MQHNHSQCHAAFVCLAALVLTFIYTSALGDPARPSKSAPRPHSECVQRGSTDENIKVIIEEIFRNTPQRLLNQRIISKAFFDRVHRLNYEICDDRLLDASAVPRTPPVIVFDSLLVKLLGAQSQALVVGRYLAQDHQAVGTLDLHTALMRHVIAQNLSASQPTMTLSDLAAQVVGRPTDLVVYLKNPTVRDQTEKLILTSFYFLIFHEFCHINGNHLQRKAQIKALREFPKGESRQSMLTGLEQEADACAMDVINRDEAQHNSSPISFLNVFMVASTQFVLERIKPTDDLAVTHPAPLSRLQSAHRINAKYIEASPDAARYRTVLDQVYQHFATLIQN